MDAIILLRGILALLPVGLLGLLLLAATTPRPPFRHRLANLALCHLVGAGAITWLLTLWAALTGHLTPWPIYLALLALIPAARRAARFLAPERAPREPLRPFERWMGGAILLGALSLAAQGLHGGLGWDAIGIWDLKARAFFADGSLSMLHDGFTYHYSHRDYPLLVPLQSWWVYVHAGMVDVRWVQALGALFYLDLLAILYGAARSWIERAPALAVTALAACAPVVTRYAVSGYADLPLAAYFLALAALLTLRCAERDRASAMPLAWILACIVLVKNEGLPAALAALVILAVWSIRGGWRALLAPCALAIISYLPWMAVKDHWHLSTDLFDGSHPAHLTAGAILWRLGYTLRALVVRHWAGVAPIYPAWGLTGALLAVGTALGFKRRVAACGPLLALLALQLGGYIGIYLITPYPLRGHIRTTMDRLMLHLFPAALLLAALGCHAPGEAPSSDEEPTQRLIEPLAAANRER